MQRLGRSIEHPDAGDIFAIRIQTHPYLFGRVAAIGVLPPFSAILIYVYRSTSASNLQVPTLSKDDLLIPPVMTNQRLWSEGFFQTVAHLVCGPDDLLEQHCFRDGLRNRYVDEFGRPLPARVEPCGTYGLAGYYQIDCEISDALGIERAPRPLDPIG